MHFLVGVGGYELIHELTKFDTPSTALVGRFDLACSDFEGGEQRRSTIALIVMTSARQRPAVGQLQIALSALQRLDRRLLVYANHHRVLGWRQAKTDHIGGLGSELRIGALAPGFAPRKINLVLAQNAPDALFVDIAQTLGDQRRRPAPIALGDRLVQHRKNALVGFRRVALGLARPQAVFQPLKPLIGKAIAPSAHDRLFNTDRALIRARARSLRRQQYHPRSPDIALRRPHCPAPSLNNCPILRTKPYFSCLRNY